jgi:hypothetical protein
MRCKEVPIMKNWVAVALLLVGVGIPTVALASAGASEECCCPLCCGK